MRVRTGAFRTAVVLAAVTAVVSLPAPASAAVRFRAADSLERAVVAKINSVRKARGLRALAVRAPLTRAANDHAVNMVRNGYFSHSWSNGASFDRWIRRYWPGPGRYSSWSVGENLYWRHPDPTARQVVAAWMNSPPHRRNLLKRDWRSVGVGAVLSLDPFGSYAGVPTAMVVAAEFGRRS